MSLFERIRSAAARVTSNATHVRIVPDALASLAESLAAEAAVESSDPAHRPFEDADTTLAFVITLDAVNFGSGWFPVLSKIPGRSGYLTISTRLRQHFARHGAWSADELSAIDERQCCDVFGQDPDNTEANELMQLYARSLSDLGRFLAAQDMRSFADLVEAASGSAERLAGLLDRMPLYRDVSRYHGIDVPLYKRAQITAADLSLAFGGQGPGRFADLDRLTMFADNLVPHVLRCEGVLQYDAGLLARIDRGELLPPGSPEEVEIRAVGLHAVEQIVSLLSSRGEPAGCPAHRVDQLLWNRGQSPGIKRRNRHRTRSVYY